MKTEAMKVCNIPDPRLSHNGGDITIGEQIWQGGFSIAQFNERRQFVRTSDNSRRGFSETFQWYR